MIDSNKRNNSNIPYIKSDGSRLTRTGSLCIAALYILSKLLVFGFEPLDEPGGVRTDNSF